MAEKDGDGWVEQIPRFPITVPGPKIPNAVKILNTATRKTSNVDDINIDGDFEDEPETWIEPIAGFIWEFLLNHGLKIAIFFCIYSLFTLIFKKLYLSGVLSYWKNYIRYLETLERMQTLLEADYKLELWSEPTFCKQYLELYDAFRRLRSFANRDHLGNSLIDDRKRQEEAKPLYPFFDTDYELYHRLLYALDGTEWTGQDEEEEAKVEESEQAVPTSTSSEGLKKRHQNIEKSAKNTKDTKSDRNRASTNHQNSEKGRKCD